MYSGSSEVKPTKLVSLVWKGDNEECGEVIRLPVPYQIPPRPYSSGGLYSYFILGERVISNHLSVADVPWSWDRRYTEKDVYGQVWPRQVKLYSSQDL